MPICLWFVVISSAAPENVFKWHVDVKKLVKSELFSYILSGAFVGDVSGFCPRGFCLWDFCHVGFFYRQSCR